MMLSDISLSVMYIGP